MDEGRELFENYCAACHGQELGEAPPLDGSPWVAGAPETLIKITLHGVRGRIEIGGESFDREMPGIGGALSDDDLARLLSFVRAEFGSISEPVKAQTVATIREANRGRIGDWDIDELRESPADDP
ncbi:MAG: cytochrome c [Acidobacteriota bacterium]|nr:cytochrome c [Acidobacteriota bacterium]